MSPIPNEFKDPDAIERRGDGVRAEKLIDFANALGWRVHSFDLRNTASGTGTIFTVALYREGTDGETIDATPAAVTQDEPLPVIQIAGGECDHEPSIMHRSGGASAKLNNYCGRCGRYIRRADERLVWEIDEEREKASTRFPKEAQ